MIAIWLRVRFECCTVDLDWATAYPGAWAHKLRVKLEALPRAGT